MTESCFVISAVEECIIRYEGLELKLNIGESSLIPASLDGVDVAGDRWLLSKVK